jgi:4-hydroxy-tetrahydrodipicolinate synthase
MSPQLAGVIPPIVTPFTASEEVDEDALRAEINYMLEAGAHGITLTGSTGEGHTMTVEDSCLVARIAVAEVGGRVPVVSGIIQDSTRTVVRYGRALKDQGVDALQITPVHYLFAPGRDGTLRYYEEIGSKVQLPIVIYNVVPWNTIDVPTLLDLAEQEWIIGVKQSGGDIHKLADLLRAVRATGSRLRVLSAVDALLFSSYLMGAHGSIAAVLAVLPRQSVALWNACQAGDIGGALEIHEAMLPLWRILEVPSDMTARVKAAISLQGRAVGDPRRPLLPVSAEVRAELDAALEISGELATSSAVAS